MFTIEQIKAAHAKVKSGADFPGYVQELIQLGVAWYETFVADGNTVYSGQDDFKTASGPKYAILPIANQGNKARFLADLKAHQQGKTDYPTFCNDCAQAGIEKWVVDMSAMTCIYYDKAGNLILKEIVPVPAGR